MGTGTYTVQEDTAGNKYLQCDIAGTIALQSCTAYGEWEFDVYKGTANGILKVDIISNGFEIDNYQFVINNIERVMLLRGAYVGNTVMYTAFSYVSINTLYRIKITRTESGIFTMYIKGGAFGNNFVLADVTGGSGTNPATDNTYTTSKYLVADLDAGDRIDNIKITNGIKQF